MKNNNFNKTKLFKESHKDKICGTWVATKLISKMLHKICVNNIMNS